MDLTTVLKALSDEGIHVCPICGTPFEPYHSRQKTCGAPDCRRLHHNQYVKDRVDRLKREQPEKWRAYHAKANRKHRHKQYEKRKREAELKDLQDRWEKQEEFDRRIAEYGLEYGKRSAEKVLATVPKIDVSIERREPNDNVHAEDDRE